MRVIFLGIVSLALVSATGQELTDRQKANMVQCALHGERGGSSVEANLYADGKVNFSYTLEPSERTGSRDLYVLFWNAELTEGRLLEFDLSETAQGDLFIITNEAWIWDNKGQLDVSDALGGMYSYRQIKGLLPKLKKQPPTLLSIHQLPPMSAVCKTP